MPKPKQARWQKQTRFDEENPSHDRIFDRVSGLKKPGPRATTPEFIEDNLPKDVFFPVTQDDIRGMFDALPAENLTGITHIWLRKAKSSEFRSGRIPLAEYVRTEDICLIALYPWPENMQTPLTGKPGDAILSRYKRWAPELMSHKAKWLIKWRPETVGDFYLNELLKGEINHHAEMQQKMLAGLIRSGLYARQRYFENTLALR